MEMAQINVNKRLLSVGIRKDISAEFSPLMVYRGLFLATAFVVRSELDTFP
jgi:hypothetical protein